MAMLPLLSVGPDLCARKRNIPMMLTYEYAIRPRNLSQNLHAGNIDYTQLSKIGEV